MKLRGSYRASLLPRNYLISLVDHFLTGDKHIPKHTGKDTTKSRDIMIQRKKIDNTESGKKYYCWPRSVPEVSFACIFIAQWFISYISLGKEPIITQEFVYGNT